MKIHFIFVFGLIIGIIFWFTQCQSSTNQVIVEQFMPLNDTVKYMGIQTCRSCHNDIHHTFQHTGMGRSFDKATPSKSDATYNTHSLVYDEKSDFYYRPFFKDSVLYVREFRLNGGDTIHKRTEQIAYIVGSGQHTNSHIINTNGYIYQAPITFYTQDQKWDMAPGYTGENLRFSRLLSTECITCHNHLPEQVGGSMNKYTEMPSGIECERCHGPGEEHVRRKLKGELIDTATQVDYSIVNPRHLTRDLQMDLCQRCHLQGVAVLQEGKTFFDFKAGMQLNEVMNVFLPRYTNSHEKFIMASQADRLRKSPCYVETVEMSCITCHNPHKSIDITPAAHYNQICSDCHQEKKCLISEEVRAKEANNCVGCHMPKSGSIDIPHVNITDHFISRHTAKSIPKHTISEEEKSSIAQFLGLECLTDENINSLEMARGYIALFDKYVDAPAMLDSAYFHLNLSKDNSSLAFKTWIHYFFAREDYPAILEKAKQYNPSMTNDAWTAYRIGEAYYQSKNYPKALLWYKKATQLMPFHLDFQEKLGTSYIQVQYLQEAKKCFEFILTENTKRPIAWTNLGYIYALQGDLKTAINHYDKAIALNPDYEQALLNKAAILQIQKKENAAQKLIKQVLHINPTNVQAQKMIK